MSSIKVGDKVRVTDWGKQYTTHKAWFKDNFDKLKLDWIVRYAYEDDSNYINEKIRKNDTRNFIVLYTDGIDEDCYNLALIAQPGCNTKVYLISVEALVPYKKRMTVKEVEAILGYSIEIVG